MIHKSRHIRFCAIYLLGLPAIAFSIPASTATAQNGKLIEGLFRTLAESQLEKERAKRAEAKKRPPVLQPPGQSTFKPSKDPYQVRLPSGFGTPAPRTTPSVKPPSRPRLPNSPAGSINVRSREAADYANNLVAFNQSITPLINDLRQGAVKHPEIRALLPEVYKIAADGRALLQRCDGISSLNPIIKPYQSLDARWRKVSFALNSINGLSASCTNRIGQCDQHAVAMCKQLQIEPQFDRHALRNQMVIAATYMQTIVDDLELSSLPQAECHRLAHDCRLLRQRLIHAADHVDEVTYGEISQSFAGFVEQWGAFAQAVYSRGNPHLNRRLARVSECGDHVYAILWMAPPASFHDVVTVAHRLDSQVEALSGQITFRTIAKLPGQDQIRVLNATRQLYEQAVALERAAEAKANQAKLQQLFGAFDQTWASVQPDYHQISSVNRGILSEIDGACGELRSALGISGGAVPITANQLVQSAAALEGTAEYINRELKRYERDLTPGSFRNSVTDAAREFYNHSKELHEEVSKPGRLTDSRYLSRLQRETKRMLEGWDQLVKDLGRIEQHGLPRNVAFQLKRAQRDITPFVAQVAAALLEG